MVSKRAIIFFGFALCFFYLFESCFAFDIKPCEQEVSDKSGTYLSFIFCPLDYDDLSAFTRDRETLIRKLKTTQPFNEFNNFKFWYINLSPEEGVQVFKSTSDFPPLKVRKDFLSDVSLRLKGVYKLIIVDAQGSMSCAELSGARIDSLIILGRRSYDNDDNFAKGFLHELGHSFGLRDECVNCLQRSSRGYPNCAAIKEEAEKWWGDLVMEGGRIGYISGCCGNKDYIRPTIASLMNDFHKADDFGPVNERYLRKELGSVQ